IAVHKILLLLSAQPQFYNLTIQNPLVSNNEVCFELLISFDQAGKLGSSNLVFDYDENVLGMPTLAATNLSPAPYYQATTLSTPRPGRVSINIELSSPGFGDQIPGGGATAHLLTQVCFTKLSNTQGSDLDWFINGTVGTVIYLDDESTLLQEGTITNLEHPSVFPVDWLDFSGYMRGKDAVLDWSTALELNNLYFDIERSADGVMFQRITQVPSQGNSQTIQTYQALDQTLHNVGAQEVFYRLRQVDIDGGYSYSPTINLSLDDLGVHLLLTPYSTPFTDYLEIGVQRPEKKRISLEVFNQIGQHMGSYPVQEGSDKVHIPTASWSPGIYHVQATYENHQARVSVNKK
ncbi:MAG: hypothetical protein AAFP92_13860, partial [Bacteroidota bacterium]